MKQYSDLEYLKLSKGEKFLFKLKKFLLAIPLGIAHFFVRLWKGLLSGLKALGGDLKEIGRTFTEGDWKTRTSFFVMGFGNLARGQILRGILFLLFEIVFIGYMVLSGGYWLSMLPSLGKVGPMETYNEILDTYTTTYNDNSFKILLSDRRNN